MVSETPYSGRANVTLSEFLDESIPDEDETCPNGEKWCEGPEGDNLPCFECFDPEQNYDVGGSR